MSRQPTPPLSAVPFPCGEMRWEKAEPSLSERVLELEEKLWWLKNENRELKKKNRSLEAQLRNL